LSFSLTYMTGDQVLNISPFTATASCGTAAWIYTGVDPSDSHSLSYATDLISVDYTTGAITISTTKAPGTYSVKVIGTLPDLVTTKNEIFSITIGGGGPANSAPSF
jgi:hypothetical protein